MTTTTTIPTDDTTGAAAEPSTAVPVNSNFTIVIIGPPPPFPAPPRSVDLSPLKFILAIVAVISIPAIAYALFFAGPCHPGRRRQSRSRSSSSDDLPRESPPRPPTADGDPVPVSGVKFEKETHSKEIGNECPVCLSVFADGEDVRQLSACKHAFHSSCIEMWLNNHSNCPICRAAIPGKLPEGNGGGGNRRVSASHRNDDWHQGLPDASTLV